jgi:hypothetical protein
METDPLSERCVFYKVRKSSGSECYTPSSKLLRIDIYIHIYIVGHNYSRCEKIHKSWQNFIFALGPSIFRFSCYLLFPRPLTVHTVPFFPDCSLRLCESHWGRRQNCCAERSIHPTATSYNVFLLPGFFDEFAMYLYKGSPVWRDIIIIIVITYFLRGLSPQANYTDRAAAVCRRSYRQLLRIKSATWSA